MTISVILFDWNGTLAYLDRSRALDPVAVLAGELERVGEAFATDVVEPLRDAFRALGGRFGDEISLDELLHRACAHAGIDVDEGALPGAADAFARAVMAGQMLYDDARAALASLKYRGYRIAIVSNLVLPAAYVRDHLRELGAAGYVDAVVTSTDVGHAKPHPAIFLRALEMVRAAPAEALVVGDGLWTDIEGAEAAGIASVLLDRDGRYDAVPVPRISRLTGLTTLIGEGPAVSTGQGL